jgi:WD40 repeat protein
LFGYEQLRPGQASLAHLLDHPASSRVLEYRLCRKDQSVRWVEGTLTNLLDVSGIETFIWMQRDITELVSGSSDKTVQILDAATGERLFTYRGHSDVVNSVSWAPDGKRLASGSRDKTVQVWEALTGKVAYIYDGYNVKVAQTNSSLGVLPDLIFVVAWSHNGKRLAAVTQVYCGDNCGVVVVWDADTERNVTFYIDTPIFALAWSPDDTRFVTTTDVTTQGTGPYAGGNDPEAGPYAQIVWA